MNSDPTNAVVPEPAPESGGSRRKPHLDLRRAKGQLLFLVAWAGMAASGGCVLFALSMGMATLGGKPIGAGGWWAVEVFRRSPLALVYAVAIFVIAVLVVRRLARVGRGGRQRMALGAAEARRWDGRPPVLYLRSFLDDGRPFPRRSRLIRRPLLALVESESPTLEEILERRLARKGPVLAIGRPGEELPPVGAAREYVSHKEWQHRARVLMDEAGLVILCVGPTPGLAWEFRTLTENLPPEKILLVFPCVNDAELEAIWRAFVANCGGSTRAKLPENPGRKAVMAWFSSTWTCQIERSQRLGSGVYPRTEADYLSCLKAVTRRLDRRWSRERTMPQRRSSLLRRGLGALTLGALGLPFWYYGYHKPAAVLTGLAMILAVQAFRVARYVWIWSRAYRPWLVIIGAIGAIVSIFLIGSGFMLYMDRQEAARLQMAKAAEESQRRKAKAATAVPSSKTTTSGPLQFRLASVEIACPKLRVSTQLLFSRSSKRVTSDEVGEETGLIIRIEIVNGSGQPVDISDPSCRVFEDDGAFGSDLSGYSYPISHLSFYSPVGQIVTPAKLAPGKSVEDVWLFQPPEGAGPYHPPTTSLIVEYSGQLWSVPAQEIRIEKLPSGR